MTPITARLVAPEYLLQFVRFCLVGVSGTVVDMAVLGLMADPRLLGLDVTLSKISAAELALINNFVWNELWTFSHRLSKPDAPRSRGVVRRFVFFNAICGAGILFAVLLLHLFHGWLGCNLYLSNALAIGIVTLWNVCMNARFNWHSGTQPAPPNGACQVGQRWERGRYSEVQTKRFLMFGALLDAALL